LELTPTIAAFAIAAPVFLIASEQPSAYVAGATAGTLVGTNRGKFDAFLRRLNPVDGNALWTDQ
jgi:hypothetical protein